MTASNAFPAAPSPARRADGEFEIRLADGRTLRADHVVLALGNPSPARPSFADAFGDHWVNDPWDAGARNKLAQRDGALLVLGTGLTMIDVVQSLRAAGHRAPLIALSRRGLLPNIHRAPRAWPPFLDDMQGAPLAKIVRRVRDEVDRAAAQGIDWRQVLEGARPSVQTRGARPIRRRANGFCAGCGRIGTCIAIACRARRRCR